MRPYDLATKTDVVDAICSKCAICRLNNESESSRSSNLYLLWIFLVEKAKMHSREFQQQERSVANLTADLANEIVTEPVADSINASNFTIPWEQIVAILVQVLIEVTPYLLACAGIALLTKHPGAQAQAYVTRRYSKRLKSFNMLLMWRTRHQVEARAEAHNLFLTTVQARDMSLRLLNKIMTAPVSQLDGVIGENLDSA